MSSPSLLAAQPERPEDTSSARLAALRARLNGIDDAVHDLLMQRALVIDEVAALVARGKVAFRPGREADIIRRLLRRHRGRLPARLMVRLWREMFAATTSMQQAYVISVCETRPGSPLVQAAREHFGALTPLRVHGSPAQALAEVRAGGSIAGVLPLPVEDETPGEAWWTALLSREAPRVHVVARLPFWAPRAEGAPQAEALVVAAAPPDASEADASGTDGGGDRSLIGLEVPAEMSRARLAQAMITAGFAPGAMILRRDAGEPVAQALVDVAGFVADGDARLAGLTGTAVVLGAYAVPVGEPHA